MIVAYWFTIFIILSSIIFIILVNYNLIFQNTKIGEFFKNKKIIYFLKRIISSAFTIFLIIGAVFILMQMMPKEYFVVSSYNSSSNYYMEFSSTKNIFKSLFKHYYNLLPFPKKICSSTCLENGIYSCNKYEYKLIDLGISYTYIKNVRVWSIINDKCLVSFKIGIIAYLLQCFIGYPLGIYIAKRENKLADKITNTLYVTITSIPTILYFYIFILLFMIVLKLPVTYEEGNYLSYIAPIVSIVLCSVLAIAFWVKKYISLEANKDYVKFALSKGLDNNTIFYKHITRNSLIPLIRTIPTSLVACLSGFYLLEAAYNIPGIGQTLFVAINLQDVYLVQGLILFFSSLSIFSYLIGDLITICLDPRIKFKKEDKNE